MPSLHQILTGSDGTDFVSIDNAVVCRQMPAKIAKNDKMYCTAFLQNGSSDVMLQLWDEAATWKLQLNTPITLRGKFSKGKMGETVVVKCEQLIKPEGAVLVEASEIKPAEAKPTIHTAIDAGLRAAAYVAKKEGGSDLCAAAFAFAAKAFLDGHKLE